MQNTLLAGLQAWQQPLSPSQLQQLCTFGSDLLEKNEVMNLTAIKTPEEVARLHFLDSLALLRLADFHGKSVIDIGCGAGFPGVPLKIGEPTIRLTLLDALQKRMRWLEEEALPHAGVEAVCVAARAEEYVAAHREQFDIATSRAVARLNMLCELCLPYVKPGGCFLAMKGAMADEEAQEASAAIAALGGRIARIAEYALGDAVHRVVIIEKVKHTPKQYPRRFSKIKQQPL